MKKLIFALFSLAQVAAAQVTTADILTGQVRIQTRVKQGSAAMISADTLLKAIRLEALSAMFFVVNTNNYLVTKSNPVVVCNMSNTTQVIKLPYQYFDGSTFQGGPVLNYAKIINARSAQNLTVEIRTENGILITTLPPNTVNTWVEFFYAGGQYNYVKN